MSLIIISTYILLKYNWKKGYKSLGAQIGIPAFQTAWIHHCQLVKTHYKNFTCSFSCSLTGPFSRGQTHTPNVNHWVCLCSTQRSMGASYQGRILSLAKCLVGLWTGNLPVCLQCLNSLSRSLYSLLTGGNTEIFFGWR